MTVQIRSKLLYWRSDQSEGEKRRLDKHLVDCSFSCAVELIATSNEESSLRSLNLPEAPVYYTADHLGVETFIQVDVVQRLVGAGSLVALSRGTFIDKDNVAAILPGGILVLSLQKESYEQFGIVGKLSAFQGGQRYVVEIDLLAQHFRPGKPNYERLKVALTKNLPLKMDFLLAIDPHSGAEASVQTLLKASKHDCSETTHKHITKTPQFQPGEDSSCNPIELYTWLGALSSDIEGDVGGPGVYESSFSTNHLSGTTQHITRHRWTGMIHPFWLQTAVGSVRGVASSCSHGNSALQAVHVWGFEDAPVSQGRLEHGYFMHGENMLSVVFSGSQAHLFRSVATYDHVQ